MARPAAGGVADAGAAVPIGVPHPEQKRTWSEFKVPQRVQNMVDQYTSQPHEQSVTRGPGRRALPRWLCSVSLTIMRFVPVILMVSMSYAQSNQPPNTTFEDHPALLLSNGTLELSVLPTG